MLFSFFCLSFPVLCQFLFFIRFCSLLVSVFFHSLLCFIHSFISFTILFHSLSSFIRSFHSLSSCILCSFILFVISALFDSMFSFILSSHSLSSHSFAVHSFSVVIHSLFAFTLISFTLRSLSYSALFYSLFPLIFCFLSFRLLYLLCPLSCSSLLYCVHFRTLSSFNCYSLLISTVLYSVFFPSMLFLSQISFILCSLRFSVLIFEYSLLF